MNTQRITIISICVLVACFVMAGIFAFAVASNDQFFNETLPSEQKKQEEPDLPSKENVKPLSEAPQYIQDMINTYFIDADGNLLTSLKTDDYYKDWDGYYEKVLRACRKQWDKLTEMQQQSYIDEYLFNYYSVPDGDTGLFRYDEENKPDMTDEELLERVILFYGKLGSSYVVRINRVINGELEKYKPRPDIEKIREWFAYTIERTDPQDMEDYFYLLYSCINLSASVPDFCLGSGMPSSIIALDDTLTRFLVCGYTGRHPLYYVFDETYEHLHIEELCPEANAFFNWTDESGDYTKDEYTGYAKAMYECFG